MKRGRPFPRSAIGIGENAANASASDHVEEVIGPSIRIVGLGSDLVFEVDQSLGGDEAFDTAAAAAVKVENSSLFLEIGVSIIGEPFLLEICEDL